MSEKLKLTAHFVYSGSWGTHRVTKVVYVPTKEAAYLLAGRWKLEGEKFNRYDAPQHYVLEYASLS